MSGRGGAEERVRRVVSLLFGVAALVFGLISLGALLGQLGDAPPWWTAGSLVAILGTSLALGVAAPFAPPPALRALAGAVAVGYGLVAVTMPFVFAPVAGTGAAPWPLGLTALATTAAALAFRPAVAWCSTVALGVSVLVDRVTTAGSDLLGIALQDAAYAAFFAAVFVGLAIGALTAAQKVDAAAAAADRAAVDEALERQRQEEHARVDALVHDRVLTTLLLAARGTPGAAGAVRRQAAAARADLVALLDPAPPAAGVVDATALADRLRSRLTLTAPWAELETVLDGAAVVPVPVADALLGAVGEALRNAVRHAGDDASIAVRFEAGAGRAMVTVLDDGVGFDPEAAPAGRLGIASSIVGRMRAAGGEGVVRSRPGRGTAVLLTWSAR